MGKYLQGKKMVVRALCVSALCFSLAACNDDKAQTYKADSDTPPSSHAAYASGQGSLANLTWNAASKNWKTVKTSPGMQRVTFSVAGKEGNAPPASAAISVIDGQAGGLVANVNRWRGQIGLEPLDEAKITAQAQHEKTALGDAQWFEIVNDKEKSAMLVAVIDVKGTSVFVKLFGPADIVKENKAEFIALNTSLRNSAHDKQ